MKVTENVCKRLLPILLAITMVFSMMPATVFGAEGATGTSSASQFSDMPENWSTKALESAVANGLLSGADGKIMPDQNLTRAQMATVITRAFGATVKGDLGGFADVKSTDWFSDGMAKAYQMGVIQGSGSLMNPNSAITRQEVFVILARAFRLQPAETITKTFNDANQIADWAKGEVFAFVNAGYIQGANGKLNPKNLISRAEFAQIFDNILKQYINTAGEVTQVATGNVMINAPGVTLKNLKVNGDLIIGDGVGDGEATLDSVTVTGRLVIRGGGENSIIIKGTSSVSNVIVARVDGVVSVKVQGDADVEVIYIDDGSDDVNVEGIFGNIEIAAPEIVVNAIGATITNLTVAGEGSSIVVDSTSKVSSVTIQAPNTQISGTGTVTKVEAQAGATGSKIETPNTQISVGAGVSGVTGGGNTQIQPGSTVNNNQTGSGTTPATAPPPTGGGGGGDTTPTVNATAISIANATTVTFTSDVAGATIKWNGKALSTQTVVGTNTVTVPLMAPNANNTLVIEKSGYITFTKDNLIYASPYDETAVLGEWVKDRTEPKTWDVTNGAITIETKEEPNNNWYAWQGRSAATNIGLTSNWMMETDLVLTQEMVARDGIRASIWLQVEGSENFGKVNQSGVIDWAILQFKKDSATDVAGWQNWNSDAGSWSNLDASIPKIAGTYKLTIIYDEGTINQYIDGILVKSYPINVDEGVSAPTHVIIQSYSFGASYSVTWKVPTVKYLEQYPADAKFVSTVAELKAAIAAAEDNDTIYVTDGDYALTEQLNITKPLKIIGIGEVTIKPATTTTWSTVNGSKHLLDIKAGTAVNPITLENITFDSDGKAYGVNTYNNAYGILKDVTIKNSKGAGLTVNGSTIIANDLNTNGNSWGAVNVDPGSGVLTPSKFTITGSGTLQEPREIWADSDNVIGTTVTVEATGYSQYQYWKSDSDLQFLWAKNLKGVRIGNVVYPSIKAAVDEAASGDTILVAAGQYALPENTRLIINKSLSIIGAGKDSTTITAKAFKDTGESITSPMLETRADNITISGIHFEWDLNDTAPSGNGNAAVLAGDNVNINNNRFTILNAEGYPAVVMIGRTTGSQPLVNAEEITFDQNDVEGSVSVVTASSGSAGVNVSITNNDITCTNMEGIWIDQTATLDDVFTITGNTITSMPEGFSAIKLVKQVGSVNGAPDYTIAGISAANKNATVELAYLPGDIHSEYPSRLYALSEVDVHVIGYGVVVSFIDFQLGDVEDLSISVYKADGDILQTNTLIGDLRTTYPTLSQIMSPFDVSGGFNYAADGYWETDGDMFGSEEVPAYGMAKITLESGKTINKRIEFWTFD